MEKNKAFKNIEIYGEENLKSLNSSYLIIPNKLSLNSISKIKDLLKDKEVTYLIDNNYVYNSSIKSFLTDEQVLAFSSEQSNNEIFQSKFEEKINANNIFIFVPSKSITSPSQLIQTPSKTLKFLLNLKVPSIALIVNYNSDYFLKIDETAKPSKIILSFSNVIDSKLDNSFSLFLEECFNASEKSYNNRSTFDKSLAFIILRSLKKNGSKNKLIDGFDGKELSFSKILAISIAFLSILKKRTIKKRIGIILPPGKASIISNISVLLSGKIPVNFNFTSGEKSFQSCVSQSGVDAFITANSFIKKTPLNNFIDKDKIIHIDKEILSIKNRIIFYFLITKILPIKVLSSLLKIQRNGGNEEATLIFTSGSSGDPKGVILSHKNIISNISQFGSRICLNSDNKLLSCLPLFHSFGFTVTMCYPIIEGINIVTYPSPLEYKTLSSLIEKHSIDLLVSTPTFLRGYLTYATKDQLSSLKFILTGAEKLPKTLKDKFKKTFDKNLLEGYGLTETSPVTNINIPNPKKPDFNVNIPIIKSQKEGSVGQLIPGLAIKITDPDTNSKKLITEQGIIWFRGPNIFRGYLSDSQKTKEVIKDEWFMTGDIGRVDDEGFLYIEGRTYRFSKVGGEMIPHETLENSIEEIIQTDSQDRSIAIVGLPDEKKGEILVLLSSLSNLDINLLRNKLIENGIPSLWIPKKVVQTESIPILTSGKLDYKKCILIANQSI